MSPRKPGSPKKVGFSPCLVVETTPTNNPLRQPSNLVQIGKPGGKLNRLCTKKYTKNITKKIYLEPVREEICVNQLIERHPHINYFMVYDDYMYQNVDEKAYDEELFPTYCHQLHCIEPSIRQNGSSHDQFLSNDHLNNGYNNFDNGLNMTPEKGGLYNPGGEMYKTN